MTTKFTIEQFTSFDGTPIRYGHVGVESEHPQSVPIVYVPGLGGSVKMALRFLERMVPHLGPVYSIDARGFGINEGVAPKLNPESYLKDFHHFVQYLQSQGHLKSHQKPLVFGLSLGAVYTTLYLTRYDHPFQGSVLMSPAFSPHPKLFTTGFKLRNYAGLLTRGPWATTTLPYGVHDLTRNPDMYEDPNFKDPLILPTFYLYFIEQMCKKAFLRSSKLDLPTAVVVPGQDRVCDPDMMHRVYNRLSHPGKTVLSYPHLFHDLLLEPDEDLEQVVMDIHRWVETLDILQSNTVQSVPQSTEIR